MDAVLKKKKERQLVEGGEGKGNIHIERWSSNNWDSEEDPTFVVAYCGAFGVCYPDGSVSPSEFDFCFPFPACRNNPSICFDCKESVEDEGG